LVSPSGLAFFERVQMVDFILFSFFVGAFAGGWWCGKTYRTVGEMTDRAVARVYGWFK
jgi:hypothetical protein